MYVAPHKILNPVPFQNGNKAVQVIFLRMSQKYHVNGPVPKRHVTGQTPDNFVSGSAVHNHIFSVREPDIYPVSLSDVTEYDVQFPVGNCCEK